MHDETFELITQLSSERFNLYRLAGHEHLSQEQMARIQTLSDKLAVLWDQHRRELASQYRAKNVRPNVTEVAA
jgi:hypothetical protein